VLFFTVLILWRLFYVRFLASNRFLQNAVLICEQASTSGRIDSGIESIDPHYRIIGYVSADTAANVNFSHHHYVESIDKNDLAFVKKNAVSEIVIVSRDSWDY
jgi:hypothetical protein